MARLTLSEGSVSLKYVRLTSDQVAFCRGKLTRKSSVGPGSRLGSGFCPVWPARVIRGIVGMYVRFTQVLAGDTMGLEMPFCPAAVIRGRGAGAGGIGLGGRGGVGGGGGGAARGTGDTRGVTVGGGPPAWRGEGERGGWGVGGGQGGGAGRGLRPADAGEGGVVEGVLDVRGQGGRVDVQRAGGRAPERQRERPLPDPGGQGQGLHLGGRVVVA